MVPPMLAIVVLDVFLPYGVAFKLIAVSGLLALPVAVWLFGRLAGLRRPVPELMAVGAVGFLFDRTFSILGGNIPSTLAGEFSFSISLALAIVYLGLVANGLQTGRYRALAAVVVALCALTHVIPLFFAIAGTVVLLALYPSKQGVRGSSPAPRSGPCSPCGGSCRSGAAGLHERHGMGEAVPAGRRRSDGADRVLAHPPVPRGHAVDRLPRGIGVVMALARRVTPALFVVGMLIVMSVGFVVVPQGRLWNERLLPFVHLCTYLLAASAWPS
jgi:hypothetical protein